MATGRVRSYFDGFIPSNKPLEEIEKEIEYWNSISEEMDDWVDPDLEK